MEKEEKQEIIGTYTPELDEYFTNLLKNLDKGN